MSLSVPIHNFVYDDAGSIPFRIEALDFKTTYDFGVPHRHNYYEVFLFNIGGGTHIIDDHVLKIADHSIFFLPPGRVHLVRRVLNSNGFVILFSREFVHSIMEEKDFLYRLPFFSSLHESPFIDLSNHDFNALFDLCDSMKNEYITHEINNAEVLQSYLKILLLKCKRLFRAEESISFSNKDIELAQNFMRLLDISFLEINQVQEYANKLNCNVHSLNQAVQKMFGKNASVIIQERIVRRQTKVD